MDNWDRFLLGLGITGVLAFSSAYFHNLHEKSQLSQQLREDMKITRQGEITYMSTTNNQNLFEPFYRDNNLEYVISVDFPQNNEEEIFKIKECFSGPAIGHPYQVFSQFNVGDSVDVRVSNGRSVKSGLVDRYPGTTHLDKGSIESPHQFNEVNYHVKCAGSFKK